MILKILIKFLYIIYLILSFDKFSFAYSKNVGVGQVINLTTVEELLNTNMTNATCEMTSISNCYLHSIETQEEQIR